MLTKVVINLKDGIIQLEGSEEFVSKYLDTFKERIITPVKDDHGRAERSENLRKDRKTEQKTGEEKTKKSRAPKVDIEEFNIDGDSSKHVQSLEAFANSIGDDKLNKRSNEFILAICYYITKVLKNDSFSDGNIEYAYKALNRTDRPVHLRQVITNIKNDDNWFEPSGDDNKRWKLTRIGEIYYEKHLKS